jgi:methylated-DNA-[protein]-cysteine S-methyltransferase
MRDPTPFEKRVYAACANIPYGKVSTYQYLAKMLGTSPRAVGQALKRNPFAPAVPCHRVVSSNGFIGGFNGHSIRTAFSMDHCDEEIKRKLNLLASEGVRFDDCGKVVDFETHIYRFEDIPGFE